MRFKPTYSEKFDFLLSIPDTEECIDWPYLLNTTGYGVLSYKSKKYLAHRVSLGFSGGFVEPNLHAAHAPVICHRPSCVNPNHLRWATAKENIDDRSIDQTNRKPRDPDLFKKFTIALQAWPSGEALAIDLSEAGVERSTRMCNAYRAGTSMPAPWLCEQLLQMSIEQTKQQIRALEQRLEALGGQL